MNTEKFSDKAEQYAKGRPSYPAAAIDYIKMLIADDAVVADIGAGTGKLTELLAREGYEVFAVEPNTDMYEQLELTLAKYPNVKPVFATSEETKLADNSVDMITVAQALHWFDLVKFKAECKRILKPGGWIVVLYNNAMRIDNNIVLYDNDKKEVGDRVGHRRNAANEFFANPVVKEFVTPITYTRETWFAYMMSHSHSPLPSDESYDEYACKINEIFDYESKDDLMYREIVTTVYSARF